MLVPCIYCVFILVIAPYTLGVLKLNIKGSLDLEPTTNYHYTALHASSHESTTERNSSGLKRKNFLVANVPVEVPKENQEHKMINIIINNDTPGSDAEKDTNKKRSKATKKHRHSKKPKTSTTENDKQIYPIPYRPYIISIEKTKKHHKKRKERDVTTFPMMLSAEYSPELSKHTPDPSVRMTMYIPLSIEHINKVKKVKLKKQTENEKKTDKYIHRLVQLSIENATSNSPNTTVSPKPIHVKRTNPTTTTTTRTTPFQFSDEHTEPPKKTKKHKSKQKHIKHGLRHNGTENANTTATTKKITVEEFPRHVTSYIDQPVDYKDIYIETHLVRDDPKIKIFTKHIYEQSIKVLESLTEKMTNYEMKQLSVHLMRSYEDKFKEFVRETQDQKIKTRLGRQKVILNTVDTSNRILERLINYLISKMDRRGVLRNEGSENVILNEINQKKELENNHICKKMQICRSEDSFANFLVEIMTIILSTKDKKITDINNAVTEVLKNTDFSHVMDVDTEKRFHDGIDNLEEYDVATLRPIFFILKNIFAHRNSPIKVVGPEDSRVNKTMALLEILDTWDKNLPPNEQNKLEWNDLKNSFREWGDGKRNDIVDLVQHFVGHMKKVVDKLGSNDARNFERNINIILGY